LEWGDAGGGPFGPSEPGTQAGYIECRSNEDVLQMGFRLANIARVAQVEDAHRLREGACNAGALRIGSLERVRLLPRAGRA
jgi:hypothetical protein